MMWQHDGDPALAAFEPRSLVASVLNNARQRQQAADQAIAAAVRSQRVYQALTRAHYYLYFAAFAGGLLVGLGVGFLMGGGR